MKTLFFFLLTLSGVLTQNNGYNVVYPDKLICAVRGFRVSIPCSYYYPQIDQVEQKLWCSMNSNTDVCQNPPYVYNSSSNTKSDFEFTGDDKSNCTLLIHDVQFNYSGEYKFRFITNKDRYTGKPGVTLQVTDLKVSLIRLSGNGTLKQGDSLNLRCDVTCTNTFSQFVWSKNNQRLNTSGPVLHFPALTVRDSGKYTCTWKTNETSGSETISLHVEAFPDDEGLDKWTIWSIILVVILILVIVAAVIFHRKRVKAKGKNSGKGAEKAKDAENTQDKQPKPQLSSVPQLGVETLHEEEVTYASVCIKDKKTARGHDYTGEQNEDDNVIYSTVRNT